MSELNLEGEERDNYREHAIHETYDENCSTCYSENRIIKTFKEVNKPERYESNLSQGWDAFMGMIYSRKLK